MFYNSVRRIPFAVLRAILSVALVLFISVTVSAAWAKNPVVPAAAPPAPAFPAEFAKPLNAWQTKLDRIDKTLNAESVGDDDIAASRAQLDDMQDEIIDFLRALRPRVEAVRAQLAKLGDPPAQGQPAEAEPLAQQRSELNKSFADLNGAMKAGEAALEHNSDLMKRARIQRRTSFGRKLLQRSDSPFSLKLWADVAENAPSGIQQLGMVLNDWWNRITSKTQFFMILAIATVLWTLFAFVVSRAVRHLRRWDAAEAPSPWQRSSNAAWVILLRLLPAASSGAFLYFSLNAPELLPPPAIKLAVALILSLVVVSAVRAVGRTVLTIYRSEWRLVQLSDDGAAKLYWRLMMIAGLYAVDTFLGTLTRVASIPASLNTVENSIASAALAYLLISILLIRARNGEPDAAPQPIGPRYIRLPLWLVAFAIIGSVATGYIELARFITAQLIITGTILLITYLFLLWASAFALSLADDTSLAGKRLSQHAGLSQRRREQLNLPATLLLRAAILIVAIPLVMLQWGFDQRDVYGWFEKAIFGFEVGTMRISVTTFIVAIFIFMAVVAIAKAFQGWLDTHVLGATGVDDSVRNSVGMGVSYLGFGIAAVLAFSYTGLDFSNLAILAGALSVGIGFGLQSIVNNFVSGLILLAERPIKVGDWIVVGEDEGIVRRISVRSTEIEKFDQSSVIIPNSQLISSSVKNWTLHNNIGRFAIPVGVDYSSDPEEVRDLLLKVAKLHPHVLSSPEPFVYFSDFADNSLNFILYVFVTDVRRSFSVRTDLRIAIHKVFRAHGIEIPYPQTDVHLTDLAWIKRAIVERMTKQRDEDDSKTENATDSRRLETEGAT